MFPTMLKSTKMAPSLTGGLFKKVPMEHFIFQLHYRWTVLILLICSSIVTCRLYFGDSFSCMEVSGVPQRYLEMKCYSDGVYLTPVKNHSSIVTATSNHLSTDHGHGHRRYQHYCQWVNLLFLTQAAIFLLPHLVWRSYDSKCMVSRMTRGLMDETNDTKRSSELCYLAKYILTTQDKHKYFTSMYIACEIFNYVIALAQTLWLVHFFVVTGVPEFIPFDIKTWSDFQKFYFPSSAMCSLTVSKVHQQTTCLLPMNKLHMAMFLFLHAWYICLTILSGMVLVYRIVLLSPSQRVASMRICSPWAEKSTLKSLCHRLSYSDWFFLTRFQRVMSDIDFAQMLDKIVILSTLEAIDKKDDEENDRSSSSVDGHKDLVDSLADESPV